MGNVFQRFSLLQGHFWIQEILFMIFLGTSVFLTPKDTACQNSTFWMTD